MRLSPSLFCHLRIQQEALAWNCSNAAARKSLLFAVLSFRDSCISWSLRRATSLPRGGSSTSCALCRITCMKHNAAAALHSSRTYTSRTYTSRISTGRSVSSITENIRSSVRGVTARAGDSVFGSNSSSSSACSSTFCCYVFPASAALQRRLFCSQQAASPSAYLLPPVGFIGLGNMGFPMAAALGRHGAALCVYDPQQEEKAQQLRVHVGAAHAASLVHLARLLRQAEKKQQQHRLKQQQRVTQQQPQQQQPVAQQRVTQQQQVEQQQQQQMQKSLRQQRESLALRERKKTAAKAKNKIREKKKHQQQQGQEPAAAGETVAKATGAGASSSAETAAVMRADEGTAAEVEDFSAIVICMLPEGRHVREVLLSSGGLFDALEAVDAEAAAAAAIEKSHVKRQQDVQRGEKSSSRAAAKQQQGIDTKSSAAGCSDAGRVLVIDCSTVGVREAQEIAADVEERGHRIVDAPVSGGVAGAAAASLTFMAAGREDDLRAAAPLLRCMGHAIVFCGSAAGAGQAVKLCNNLVLTASMLGVAEAFRLAAALGIDSRTLHTALLAASGRCWAVEAYNPAPGVLAHAPQSRSYRGGFACDLAVKDLRLCQDAFEAVDLTCPVADATRAMYAKISRAGYFPFDAAFVAGLATGIWTLAVPSFTTTSFVMRFSSNR